jgi:hypothetical protein
VFRADEKRREIRTGWRNLKILEFVLDDRKISTEKKKGSGEMA